MLPQRQTPDSYIPPFYTQLPDSKEEISAVLARALPVFLAQFPEFSRSKSKLEILHYCYKHYVSVDPQFRQLPIQAKLIHAAKMADNFFGLVIGAKHPT